MGNGDIKETLMKIALASIVLLFASPCALAQVAGGQPYLAVHGEARTEVVPDLFPLNVILTDTGTDTAVLQARIESLAQQILEIAAESHVAETDLDVGNLDVSQDSRYDQVQSKVVFLGTRYQRRIGVTFHSLQAMKAFLAHIPAAEEIQVSTGGFGYSKSKAAKRDLFGKAIADAREMADAMAGGVGMRIAGVHTISNHPLGVQYFDAPAAMSVPPAPRASGEAQVSMLPGEMTLKEGTLTLEQDVYIVYLLAD